MKPYYEKEWIFDPHSTMWYTHCNSFRIWVDGGGMFTAYRTATGDTIRYKTLSECKRWCSEGQTKK